MRIDRLTLSQVTDEEMEGVTHHMLGFVDPLDTTFNVSKFKILALRTVSFPSTRGQLLQIPFFLSFLDSLMIEDIHKRGHVPILVGGTHYYIEAVVWSNGILDSDSTTTTASDKREKTTLGEEEKGSKQERESKTKEERETESDKGNGGEGAGEGDTSVSLWEELKRVDPTMAERLHPNNERKIKRSLEVTT